MNSLEKALKYEFKNAEILKKALTHSSFSKGNSEMGMQ